MRKQIFQISLKVFFLLALIGVNHPVFSEELPFDLDQQKLTEEFQSLSDQIDDHFAKGVVSMPLHIKRGNLLLVADEYQSAIDDYSYVINVKANPSTDSKVLSQALWGRMCAYIFLGQKKEAIEDMLSIKELMLYEDDSEFDSSTILPCGKKKSKKEKETDRSGQIDLSDLQECLNTVGNTEKYMTQKAYKASTEKQKNDMLKRTNELYEICRQRCYEYCCSEDYWQIAVEPMVKQVEEWKRNGLIR